MNWCFQTVVLEKTLESPLDCKEVKPVNPKGNQPWIFTGGTDAEAEAPILWPCDAKSQIIRKGPDAGKDGKQEKKEMTEDEMVEQHHWLKDEFEQPLGDYEAFGVSENRTRLSNSNSNNNHDKEYKSIQNLEDSWESLGQQGDQTSPS